MSLIWEMYQMKHILSAETSAHRAAGKAEGVGIDVHTLQAQVAQLALVTEAIWAIVKEQTNLSDEDLRRKVREIDLQDGVLDGRVKRKNLVCPSCGRPIHKKHERCLYCGAPIEKSLFPG